MQLNLQIINKVDLNANDIRQLYDYIGVLLKSIITVFTPKENKLIFQSCLIDVHAKVSEYYNL